MYMLGRIIVPESVSQASLYAELHFIWSLIFTSIHKFKKKEAHILG